MVQESEKTCVCVYVYIYTFTIRYDDTDIICIIYNIHHEIPCPLDKSKNDW